VLSRIEAWIEAVLREAQTDNNHPGMGAIRELRGYLELKCKLEAEQRKHGGNATDSQRQRPQRSDEELSIRFLENLQLSTKGFHPLKIWQLKAMYDLVTKLVQAKLEPKEIVERMSLRGVHGLRGPDLTFDERLFGILYGEEWAGREEEVAQSIVQSLRDGLKGYPSILQHLDAALISSNCKSDSAPATQASSD